MLGQYADHAQELLKSLFQNKTPHLSLKYQYWSKCLTSRVSSENKEKKAKRKNSVKKGPNGRKKKKSVQRNRSSVAGSRTRFICRCKQLLDYCTTLAHMKNNFVIIIFSAIDAVWSLRIELYLSWIQIYIWENYGFSAYLKAISHYFGFNGPTRCR